MTGSQLGGSGDNVPPSTAPPPHPSQLTAAPRSQEAPSLKTTEGNIDDSGVMNEKRLSGQSSGTGLSDSMQPSKNEKFQRERRQPDDKMDSCSLDEGHNPLRWPQCHIPSSTSSPANKPDATAPTSVTTASSPTPLGSPKSGVESNMTPSKAATKVCPTICFRFTVTLMRRQYRPQLFTWGDNVHLSGRKREITDFSREEDGWFCKDRRLGSHADVGMVPQEKLESSLGSAQLGIINARNTATSQDPLLTKNPESTDAATERSGQDIERDAESYEKWQCHWCHGGPYLRENTTRCNSSSARGLCCHDVCNICKKDNQIPSPLALQTWRAR
jgi:hypothetical protein